MPIVFAHISARRSMLESSVKARAGLAPMRSALRVALGMTCVTALLCGGASAANASTSAVASTRTSLLSVPEPDESAADAAIEAAQTSAAETGQAVVVEDLTTPTEQYRALPDGSIEREVSSRPVRVEKSGAWVPVDLTLSREGDWVTPVASAVPVRFAAGGSSELAQVQTESGEWVTEVWPHGDLPAALIEKDTATYPDVFPGVDLKLVATKTGMASVYVVESEKAAQSLALSDLHILVEGAELSSTSVGGVVAETSDGAELVAGQPLWWDSSQGGTFREPGGDEAPVPVAHDVAVDRITLDVGESVDVEERRSGEDVEYPIFVDPDWSKGEAAAWYTDAAFPNVSYLSAGASNVLRVGISEPYRSDMFFQFPLSELKGKQITAARLNTTLVKVMSCNPQPIGVHTFGPKTAGFTWAQEQSWNSAGTAGWSGLLQSAWTGPNCGAPATTVGWNVTSGVKAKLAAGLVQFAFTYENPSAESRRHFSRDASLIVTYNSYPDTPTDLKITSPPRTCGSATAPAVLGSSTVAVSVDQRDPDPGNVGTAFYLAKADALGTVVSSQSSGLGAKGTKTAQFTGLAEGKYAWRARGYDGVANSLAYSAWCYFTVDTTDPVVPTLSSAASTFTVGHPVSVNAAGAADVAGYVYWITPVATQGATPPPVPVDGVVSTSGQLPTCSATTKSVRWACATAGSATALTVAPVDSLSTLWVSAYDKAGNQSLAKGFPLYANGNTGTPASAANVDSGHGWHVTSLMSPLPATVPDSNPWIGANGIALVIPENASTTTVDLPDAPFESPVLDTNVGTAEEVHTESAPIDVTKSFTLSMWVKAGHVPTTNSEVIAMQDGSTLGHIQLQVTSTGKFAFCLGDAFANMSSTALTSNCATGGTVTPGTWQMVTGIWDAVNQQLRIHVGNDITPVGSVSHVPGAGVASGGSALYFGPNPDTGRFRGLIANPMALPGVANSNQLGQMAGFFLPFS